MEGLNYKQVRDLFFEEFPEYRSERRARKSQNDYSCDCRCAFIDFIDYLHKSGEISDRTAENITLG